MTQSKILHDSPLRVMEIKTKVNKLDLIKLKNFCTAKETISKLNRQPSEWEKIITNEITDKGLISFGHKACGILTPPPGIKPAPHVLEGKVLTSGQPGKSSCLCFHSIPSSKMKARCLVLKHSERNHSLVVKRVNKEYGTFQERCVCIPSNSKWTWFLCDRGILSRMIA